MKSFLMLFRSMKALLSELQAWVGYSSCYFLRNAKNCKLLISRVNLTSILILVKVLITQDHGRIACTICPRQLLPTCLTLHIFALAVILLVLELIFCTFWKLLCQWIPPFPVCLDPLQLTFSTTPIQSFKNFFRLLQLLLVKMRCHSATNTLTSIWNMFGKIILLISTDLLISYPALHRLPPIAPSSSSLARQQ